MKVYFRIVTHGKKNQKVDLMGEFGSTGRAISALDNPMALGRICEKGEDKNTCIQEQERNPLKTSFLIAQHLRGGGRLRGWESPFYVLSSKPPRNTWDPILKRDEVEDIADIF